MDKTKWIKTFTTIALFLEMFISCLARMIVSMFSITSYFYIVKGLDTYVPSLFMENFITIIISLWVILPLMDFYYKIR